MAHTKLAAGWASEELSHFGFPMLFWVGRCARWVGVGSDAGVNNDESGLSRWGNAGAALGASGFWPSAFDVGPFGRAKRINSGQANQPSVCPPLANVFADHKTPLWDESDWSKCRCPSKLGTYESHTDCCPLTS